jgi:chromosome segregation ATPase
MGEIMNWRASNIPYLLLSACLVLASGSVAVAAVDQDPEATDVAREEQRLVITLEDGGVLRIEGPQGRQTVVDLEGIARIVDEAVGEAMDGLDEAMEQLGDELDELGDLDLEIDLGDEHTLAFTRDGQRHLIHLDAIVQEVLDEVEEALQDVQKELNNRPGITRSPRAEDGDTQGLAGERQQLQAEIDRLHEEVESLREELSRLRARQRH